MPKKGGKGFPWQIYYYQGDDLIAIATADDLEVMTGRRKSTIRKYAADKRRFTDGMLFMYEPEYYENDKPQRGNRSAPNEIGPYTGGKTLRQMAKEAKRRGVSYGQLQAEEYHCISKRIVVPEGYTSMRDREGKK